MEFKTGDLVSTQRTLNTAMFWKKVHIKTPGVVTAVGRDREGRSRYTVAFEIRNVPGRVIVVKGLKRADLISAA